MARIGAARVGTALLGAVVVAVACAVVAAHDGSDSVAATGSGRPAGVATAGAPVPVLAAGPDAAVTPGTPTETPGAGICTSGFVFTAGETVLLSQAAHCAGTGDSFETDGCTSATLPTGTPVTVRAAGRTLTGTMRYSSWTAMRRYGERDPATCAYNDFALVELPPGSAALTSPTVPFAGGPRGVRTSPVGPGTVVAGLSDPGAARERFALGPRTGVTVDDDPAAGGWLHTVRTDRPGAPGESGAPLVDDAGTAVGLLTGMEVGDPDHVQYTDLAKALDYARGHGGPPGLTLATVPAPGAPAG